MRTPTSIAGHPVHPMLVTVPIGLWIFSLVCDVVLLSGRSPDLWYIAAYVTMAGGIIGALLAAVFGLIDLVSLPRGNVRTLALTHMGINVVAIVLFVVNLGLRTGDIESMLAPFTLSVIGVALIVVSGWLGGELVHVHLVGIDPGELAHRSARARRAKLPREPRHRDAGQSEAQRSDALPGDAAQRQAQQGAALRHDAPGDGPQRPDPANVEPRNAGVSGDPEHRAPRNAGSRT